MCELPNGHAAEYLQIAIETLVNKFTFDKKKIRGYFKFNNYTKKILNLNILLF